jgi:hypothetical protein
VYSPGYDSNGSPVAADKAQIAKMFMNIARVNNAPTGVASIKVYKPKTGFTAANNACAIDWGMFTREIVRPASEWEVRLFFLDLIVFMLFGRV